MEIYLLKSAAILAVLFVFYKLVLENTSIHHFKRFYLFGSLLASFLIPLITFTSYVKDLPFVAVLSEENQHVISSETEAIINIWPYILWTIYGLGVLFFSIRFFRNLFGLIRKIRNNPKHRNSSYINILLSEKVIPHTFFRYIFLNKQQFEKNEIPVEVMIHEETHSREIHSLDIVLLETLQIVFWFNPLFYFIKKSVKLNHEFLADQAVLDAGAETSTYQNILLAFSSNDSTPTMANSINYSSIKKRFTIMRKTTSRRAILFRSLLILPLLSLLIYGFSTKEVMLKSIEATQSDIQNPDKKPLLKVHVIGDKITVNDKETTVLNFAAAVDAVTNDWRKQDFKLYSLDIKEKNVSDVYRMRINVAYRNTNLAKQSDYNNGFILGPFEGISPPPPPPAIYENVPSPNQPVEHVIAMAKRNAKFLYNSKIISVDQAVQLIKNNKNLAVRTQLKDPIPPMVYIYEKADNRLIQDKATKAEVKEYNKLAKKYNSVAKNMKISISKEDVERLEAIYEKMTDEQKTIAQPFPKFPPPPPPPAPAPPAPPMPPTPPKASSSSKGN